MAAKILEMSLRYQSARSSYLSIIFQVIGLRSLMEPCATLGRNLISSKEWSVMYDKKDILVNLLSSAHSGCNSSSSGNLKSCSNVVPTTYVSDVVE